MRLRAAAISGSHVPPWKKKRTVVGLRPAGMKSVPRSSFSRWPGGADSLSRVWARVCSTMGEGFCDCWACASEAMTAHAISNRRILYTLPLAFGSSAQVAVLDTVAEVDAHA